MDEDPMAALQRTFDGAEVLHGEVVELTKTQMKAARAEQLRRFPAFRLRKPRQKKQVERLFDPEPEETGRRVDPT